MNQLDLLGWSPPEPYPATPGWKRGSTSKDAAEAVRQRAPILRAAVLEVLRTCGEKTADEVAEILGRTPFSIRPRLTELYRMSLIEPTAEVRPNASGANARVWRLVG